AVERDTAVRRDPRRRPVDGRIHLPQNAALLAVAHVDLVDVAPAVGYIQYAVFGQRRSLLAGVRLVAAALGAAELHRKGDVQILDGGAVDLVECRIPPGVVSLVVGEPVARLALGIL